MAQNITIAGATFNDVPSIMVPTAGGGQAIFADPSDTTAIAADVAQGKTFLTAQGTYDTGTASGGGAVLEHLSVTQNGTYTPSAGVDGYDQVSVNVSGGGGASNIVTGTFKGTTAGAAMDVSLDYSGNGYPVVLVIYPTGGPYNKSSGNTFYNLLQRYAIASFLLIKSNTTVSPNYSGTLGIDDAFVSARYKNSSSSLTTYGNGGANDTNSYTNGDAYAQTVYYTVRVKSAKKMSVFIASTSYGFAANVEYTYRVIYSE